MWSAAILAGGQARRFGGVDKSALLVGGRTILDRQLSVLKTLTTDILIVGGRGEAPAWARLVGDRIPGRGPLGGLHTALSESEGDATLVIACDMPFLSAPFLAHLLLLTDGADAVVPRTDRGYHPLCAAYTRACLEPAAARLARGQLKLADLLQDVRVRTVDTKEIGRFGNHDRLLANVNTEVDYSGLEAHQEHEL